MSLTMPKLVTTTGFTKRYTKSIRDTVELLWEGPEITLQEALDIEQELLSFYHKYRVFNTRFEGNGGTEFFSRDILNMEVGS